MREDLGDPVERMAALLDRRGARAGHDFLSDERIDKMPILFQKVARIAKRGR